MKHPIEHVEQTKTAGIAMQRMRECRKRTKTYINKFLDNVYFMRCAYGNISQKSCQQLRSYAFHANLSVQYLYSVCARSFGMRALSHNSTH